MAVPVDFLTDSDVVRVEFSFFWAELTEAQQAPQRVVVESPPIEVSGRKWVVQLIDEKDGSHIGYRLLCESVSDDQAFVYFNLSAVCNRKELGYELYRRPIAYLSKESIPFLRKSDLDPDLDGLSVNPITIKVELSVSETSNNPLPALISPRKAFASQVHQRLQKLHETFAGADIHLVVSNGAETQRFRAHKFVLAFHSPVFEAMFESPMTETVSQEVKIENCTADALREFVFFLYTDTVHGEYLPELAQELFVIANKYQVRGLQTLCEEYLCSSLTETNAVPLLHMAEAWEAAQMRTKVMNFNVQNMRKCCQQDERCEIPIDDMNERQHFEVLSLLLKRK